MAKIELFSRVVKHDKIPFKIPIFENLKEKYLERKIREIEETIDKIFPEKVGEVKVTKLPDVEIIEREEHLAEKKKRQRKMVREESKKAVESQAIIKTRGAPKIEEVFISKKEEGEIKQRDITEKERLEDISSKTKTGEREIGLEGFFKRKPKEPERTGEELEPLVDLSMKGVLERGLIYEHEEKEELTKKEETVEIGKEDTPEGLSDYIFLDETEPPHVEASTDLNIEKLDYGDVELPRESLRFEPMVEFRPREEELKINVPISNERFEEIDFYPVNRPYAYVKILRDKQSVEKIYAVLEPDLTKREQEYLEFIRETLEDMPKVDLLYMEERGAGRYMEELVNQIISDYDMNLSKEAKKKILYLIKRDTIGYGRIDAMMRDPYIEDISCDGARIPIFIYHRDYGSMRTNVGFENEEELSAFVIKLAQKCGKHISIAEPMLDATLPDGSRIQATLGTEVTTRGSTFTIRRFRSIPYSPIELVKMNTLSPEMLVYFWLAVEYGASGIFAGGTASGKTTTLNAIALFIPREAKIVSIEETREINLPHPNWIPGVTRSGFGEVIADKVIGEIDMYDLLKAALRQRPEYIIVGEIRGKEAYVLFQAMATGHTTYSTMHADSPQSLIHRLEGNPINIPRIMMQSLDFVCFHAITRIKDRRVRRISQVIEIVDIDHVTKEIITNEVFSWDSITDTFKYSGKSYLLEEVRAKLQMSREEMVKELNNRIKIINWMIKNNLTTFRDVAYVINEYRDNPEEILRRVEADG